MRTSNNTHAHRTTNKRTNVKCMNVSRIHQYLCLFFFLELTKNLDLYRIVAIVSLWKYISCESYCNCCIYIFFFIRIYLNEACTYTCLAQCMVHTQCSSIPFYLVVVVVAVAVAVAVVVNTCSRLIRAHIKITFAMLNCDIKCVATSKTITSSYALRAHSISLT